MCAAGAMLLEESGGMLSQKILNSGFACEIASLNFDSFDQKRKETR